MAFLPCERAPGRLRPPCHAPVAPARPPPEHAPFPQLSCRPPHLPPAAGRTGGRWAGECQGAPAAGSWGQAGRPRGREEGQAPYLLLLLSQPVDRIVHRQQRVGPPGNDAGQRRQRRLQPPAARAQPQQPSCSRHLRSAPSPSRAEMSPPYGLRQSGCAAPPIGEGDGSAAAYHSRGPRRPRCPPPAPELIGGDPAGGGLSARRGTRWRQRLAGLALL